MSDRVAASKIIFICHSYQDTPELYTPYHSDYKLIQLLNGCYRAGLLHHSTFQYPLTEQVYRNMLGCDQIHTLDYFTTPRPEWNEYYQRRRQSEHITYDQDIIGTINNPDLLENLGTYHLAVVVNAPSHAVRYKPQLYLNALRILAPGGYFLADHRAKTDLNLIINYAPRVALESAVLLEDNTAYTFSWYQPVRLREVTSWWSRKCQTQPVTYPMPLEQQYIYQKIVAYSGPEK
jgi:hypothetical protein